LTAGDTGLQRLRRGDWEGTFKVSTWRTAFSTPRSHEYFDPGTLCSLIGHDKPLWPPTLVKELIDNSLDAAESIGVAPEITVTVEADCFTVADNGGGLPPETIEGALDYDTRISDKKWYVGPTRGQLGSALKTLWPACYVATGYATPSRVEVFACGWHHTITAYGGEIKEHAREKDDAVKNGTSVRVHWPQIACYLTHSGQPYSYRGTYAGQMDKVVVDLVRDFAAGNPHSTFTVKTRGRVYTFRATNPQWKKWRACDRGSAHWYSDEDGYNLLFAHHREERRLADAGIRRRQPTLRDFCACFDGLKGTKVRKRVLEECELQGLSIEDACTDDETARSVSRRLLAAMRSNSRVPKPQALGVIGKAHMSETLAAYGVNKDAVAYGKVATFDEQRVPYIVEVAFGVRRERRRKMIFVLNHSVVFQVPADNISLGLTACRVDEDDPVVLLVAATYPKFGFTSQGKNSLTMTSAMQNSMDGLLRKVTSKFTKKKKSDAARKNRDALTDIQIEEEMERDRVREEKRQIKAAAYRSMAEAYRRASEPFNWAKARQVMYAARKLVRELTGGKSWKNDNYFTQHLLIDYINEHEDECAGWQVEFDARGHMREPHGGKFFGIGTAEVRDYVDSWTDGSEAEALDVLKIESNFPTSGPRSRFQAAVFVEKEGFGGLIERSRIAERYDVAFFSSKGQSTTATRKLVDELSQEGVRILVLHDFDRDGLRICHWLSHDNDRYEFDFPPDVVDIGLRLRDVKRLNLESESVDYGQDKDPAAVLESCDDVTEKEMSFLVFPDPRLNPQTQKNAWSGRRVELNAMTSRQFVSYIEQKLEENGVKKVVPDKDVLKIAWRRAQKIKFVNAAIRRVMEEIGDDSWTGPAPLRNLATQIRQMLRRDPLLSWDAALAKIVKRGK